MDFASQGTTVCTDGTSVSYLGETQVNCHGEFDRSSPSGYYVAINSTDENFIDIGAKDYYFRCKFAR